MENIINILMERDEISREEAADRVKIAQDELQERIDEGDLSGAYDTCMEVLGLEPDYITDLLPEFC